MKKCKSCGIPFEKHLGVEETCREKEMLKKIYVTAKEFWGSIQIDSTVDHKLEALFFESMNEYEEYVSKGEKRD